LVTRWSSTPNLQSVVCATLCDLLHFPNDDTFGMAKWLLINKIVSQIASGFKYNITEGEVDIKQMIETIHSTEVTLKKELEEEKRRSKEQIENCFETLRAFKLDAETLKTKNEEFSVRLQNISEEHQGTILKLQNELAESEKKRDESETVVKPLQQSLDETLEKVSRLEKQYREKVAEEKLLLIKVEELEKIQNQSTFVVKPIPTPQASTPPLSQSVPPVVTPTLMSEDGPLSKEELRMYKAINRLPTPGGSIRAKSNAESPRGTPLGTKVSDVSTASSPQKTGTPPSRLSITGIPKTESTSLSARGEVSDWKRRQLEKEKEAQEKLIFEQQKKQELLQSLNQPVVEVSIPNPLVEVNQSSEKEEQRLSRALNKSVRPSVGQKT